MTLKCFTFIIPIIFKQMTGELRLVYAFTDRIQMTLQTNFSFMDIFLKWRDLFKNYVNTITSYMYMNVD